MSWESIRGHEPAIHALRAAWEAGRFPHAFLFVGPEGVGKRAVALELTRALLCESPPGPDLAACGKCPGCVMVVGKSHPDLIEVARPEERTELPIALVRELTMGLSLKPNRGARRVAIVDDADFLSEEAANAFLKTLEEPPPGSTLILIGTSPELQLDTIKSRCRTLRFGPLSEGDLMAVLLDKGLAEGPEAAKALAKSADGSVARALGLADPALGAFRRELVDAFGAPNGLDAPGVARRFDAFVKEAAKESGPKRARARLLIGELARLFRAVLWEGAGLVPPVAVPADRKAVSALAARLTPEDVFALADRCQKADYQVSRMAYLPVVIEALMSDLGRTINR